MRKTATITAIVMALVMTACGGDNEVATTEAAAASTAAPAETATTTAAPAESTTTTAAPAESTTTTAAPAETTTTSAAPAPLAAPDGTINVTLTNWEFSPVSSAVTSGEPVVVNVENLSSESHTWTLLTAGAHWTSTADLDLEQIMASTQGVPGHSTDTLQFIAPEPGTYQVVCTVLNHIAFGMVAELVVEG